jgi:hypothetical protein
MDTKSPKRRFIADAKAGAGMKLSIDSNQVRLVRDKGDVMTIPASAITEISDEQDVHRRVGAAIGLAVISLGVGALMALTKSKKHSVGLTWADGDKKGGFAMQCDKNDYRGYLLTSDIGFVWLSAAVVVCLLCPASFSIENSFLLIG